MVLNSDAVGFYTNCPGNLMKKLVRDEPEEVRKIKSLEMGYAAKKSWGCLYGCGGDLSIVDRFVGSIDALETLSITNFERKADILWPVIAAHAATLKSLAVYSTADRDDITARPALLNKIALNLPQLTNLTVDFALEEATGMVRPANGGSPASKEPQGQATLPQLAKLDRLKEVHLRINLPTGVATPFAGKDKCTAFEGSVVFPDADGKSALALAAAVFDKFHTAGASCALKKVGLQFTRKHFQDRGQYDHYVACFTFVQDGKGLRSESDGAWEPMWPWTDEWREIHDEMREAEEALDL